jgi:hypothetical protein
MLADEEREHIRQEEIFRQEVRRAIEERHVKSRVKLWRFVNTSFGIWLLSTVAIGLISWSYTNWTEAKEKQRTTQELIGKLDLEIVARARNFESLLESVSNMQGLLLTFC